MRIEVISQPSKSGHTISRLNVDGVFFCFVCEDEIREVKGQPVEKWKLKGKTAIPGGEYRVVVTMSNRFKRELPLLVDVPGFEGIRIHPGNTAADTEGCLLPGFVMTPTGVAQSRPAFEALFLKIKDAIARKDKVFINIVRPAK